MAAPGFYDNKQQACLSCDPSCRLCLDLEFCASCNPGYFFHNFKCVLSCPLRSFKDAVLNVCQPCSYDCLICLTNGRCQTCDPADNRVFYARTDRCVAKEGFYDNFTQVCVACPRGCKSCLSEIFCSYCQPGYFLSNNLCLTACPARSYPDYKSNKCLSCRFDCYTCDGLLGCASCNRSADFRVMDIGSQSCLPIAGYY